MSFTLYGRHDTALLTDINDVWFQSDLKRVFENMTDRFARGTIVKYTRSIRSSRILPRSSSAKLGLIRCTRVQIVTANIAAVYLLAVYVLLRVISLRPCRCVRVLTSWSLQYGSAFLAISAGILRFWVPLVSLSACYWRPQNSAPARLWRKYVAIGALTLSITVTNWMVGILRDPHGYTLKRAVFITVIAFSVVALLWGRKADFPTAMFFVGDREEGRYLVWPTITRIVSVLDTCSSIR